MFVMMDSISIGPSFSHRTTHSTDRSQFFKIRTSVYSLDVTTSGRRAVFIHSFASVTSVWVSS
jgi:hypothetical protein